MSGRISKLDELKFEEWIIRYFPEVFVMWEDQYSDFMDLDCYIFESHPLVFNEWKFYLANKNEYNT